MNDDDKFHVQINGGPTIVLDAVLTTEYARAAMGALAICEYTRHADYDVVKIWVPKLVEPQGSIGGFGPYFYAFDGHQIGSPEENRKW